jgi:hypothetical protein
MARCTSTSIAKYRTTWIHCSQVLSSSLTKINFMLLVLVNLIIQLLSRAPKANRYRHFKKPINLHCSNLTLPRMHGSRSRSSRILYFILARRCSDHFGLNSNTVNQLSRILVTLSFLELHLFKKWMDNSKNKVLAYTIPKLSNGSLLSPKTPLLTGNPGHPISRIEF